MSEKKCKGTGRAIDHGCGDKLQIHKYGLCRACFKNWLFNTPEGKQFMNSTQLQARKKVEKETTKKARQEFKEKKEAIRSKSYYEKQLQTEVNAIVRLIDTDKGCISCDHGWDKPATRQIHAGHRISVGSNPTLRYNFYNIFSQCSICNNYKSGNERAYDQGILRIYSQGMLDYIKSLPSLYRALNLSKEELKDKITIARKVKQNILNGKDYTRAELNRILGIYANDTGKKRVSMDTIQLPSTSG